MTNEKNPASDAAGAEGAEAAKEALADLDYIQAAPTAAHPLRVARIRAVLRAALAAALAAPAPSRPVDAGGVKALKAAFIEGLCAGWDDAALATQPTGTEASRPVGSLVQIDPQARAGKEPCGECHLPAGETCDICGASAATPTPPQADSRPRVLSAKLIPWEPDSDGGVALVFSDGLQCAIALDPPTSGAKIVRSMEQAVAHAAGDDAAALVRVAAVPFCKSVANGKHYPEVPAVEHLNYLRAFVESLAPNTGVQQDGVHALQSICETLSTCPNPSQADSTGQGDVISEIAAERRRQVEAEGWTPEHDDEHASGEMAAAAACYALASTQYGPELATEYDRKRESYITETWPWQSIWWKPRGPRRDLVKAGALIVAEIERLDRLATPSQADAQTQEGGE